MNFFQRFKIQIAPGTNFSYILIYSPNGTIINPSFSYTNKNVAVIQYYALSFSKALRFQYSKSSWFQIFDTPNENALALSWVSYFSCPGSFYYGALYPDINGKIVDSSGNIKVSNSTYLKTDTNHLLNRNLKLIKLSGMPSALDITGNDNEPLANTIEFIFRILSPIASPINLLYANAINGYVSAIILNTNHQLMSRQVRHYTYYLNYDSVYYGDTSQNIYYHVDSSYSNSLSIMHWYHVYLVHANEHNVSGVNYMRCRCTVDDLTDNVRLINNVSLLETAFSPYYSYYRNTVGADYTTSTTHRITTRTPRYLIGGVNIDFLMFRVRGAIAAPTEFKKYYSYGEFLQSC